MEIDVRDVKFLDCEPEEIYLRTSKKVRKINRYCDYHEGSKATSVYRNIQTYDNTELNTVDGWWRANRVPKDDSYKFGMCSNHYGDCYVYCFVEDTRPFNDKEKEGKRHYFKLKREEKKREKGPWRTSWQFLEHYKRRVKDDAEPIAIYNTIYDEQSDCFYESNKCFFYYSMYDTEEVDEAEFEKLKASYIEKFGGWEKIDLDHTEYDGRKWY